MPKKKNIYKDPEFGLNIFILCLFIAALFIIVSQLHKNSQSHEKFFSLSGALYGPKVIPETDTCLCNQLYNSNKILPKKKYVPINECASCNIE